jgi:hypothetical protein
MADQARELREAVAVFKTVETERFGVRRGDFDTEGSCRFSWVA